MCDNEGYLGDPDDAKRTKAVENHHKWVDAAKFLGCHSIRVNAHSEGPREEQAKLATDGLRRLAEYGASHDIGVIVENHGGLSSDGAWLAGVIKAVDLPNCGTLPDFGNFGDYDRYKGVRELMPYAKGVSAKSHEFDEQGNEVRTDYSKMMKIVLDAGYHGYVGIEWEGEKPEDEKKGVMLTKRLLERVRDQLSKQA
jgi:sugar phosphate isomerase/epimerase